MTSVGLTTATARALLGRTGPARTWPARTWPARTWPARTERSEPAGLAEAVAVQLGDAIRRGILLDGERLPAEPRLAAQLGVSTVTLREALVALRQQGLVVTRRGRGGGTFVVSPDMSAELASRLRELSCSGLRDLGDQRAAVSGTAARLAAGRALPIEVAAIRDQLDRFAAATAVGDRRRASTQLGLAIAAAAQSPRLVQAELQLAAEIGDLLWLGVTDSEHAATAGAYEALAAAIEAGEPAQARDLAEERIRTETTRLVALRLQAYDTAQAPPLQAVGAELDSLIARLVTLGTKFAEAVREPARHDDLTVLHAEIFAILADHGDLAMGAGVITAPDVLTDASLWLEWWWTPASGNPERLRVNLDPAAPDFYDYTTAPWYTSVEESGEPQAVGPYVDHLCTGDYTITMSVPVRVGGRFVGVAAADVLVSSLEHQIVPALGRDAVALTSADGRVIASTSPDLPPGSPGPADIVLDPAPMLSSWRMAGKVGNSALRS